MPHVRFGAVLAAALAGVLLGGCAGGIAIDDLQREVDSITAPDGFSLTSESAVTVHDLTNRPWIERRYESRVLNAGGVNFDSWLQVLRAQGFRGEVHGTSSGVLRRGDMSASLSCRDQSMVNWCLITYSS